MIINLFDNKKYGAFSLAEALVVMLIVSIISMVTLPIVTKKRSVSTHSLHGKWACTYFNDSYQQASASDPDHTFAEDDFSAVEECQFPLLSKAVKYLFVETYPSGGGGTRGYAYPWKNIDVKYKFGDTIKFDGDYNLGFYMYGNTTGNSGLDATWEKLTAYETTTSSAANYHYTQVDPMTSNPDDLSSQIRTYCFNNNTTVNTADQFKSVKTTTSGEDGNNWQLYSACESLNIEPMPHAKRLVDKIDEEGNVVIDPETGDPVQEEEDIPDRYNSLAERSGICKIVTETGALDPTDESPCVILSDSHQPKVNGSDISRTDAETFNTVEKTINYCYRKSDLTANSRFLHPINSLYSTNGTSLVDMSPNYYIYSSSALFHSRYVNNTANALLRECQSEICAPGKHTHCECKRDGDNVIYSFDDKECEDKGKLDRYATEFGIYQAIRIEGKIPLLAGDQVSYRKVAKTPHPAKMVGNGYVVKGGKDPADFIITLTRDGDTVDLFRMKDGKVANFSDYHEGFAYFETLKYNFAGYSKTMDTNEFYIVHPTPDSSHKTYDYNFTIEIPFNDSVLEADKSKYFIKHMNSTTGPYGFGGYVLSKTEDDFLFVFGCAGESPNRYASAYITTNRANRYTFEVGMGGQGDAGPEKSNDIFTNHRAQKGGVTRFENIMVEGGNPGAPASTTAGTNPNSVCTKSSNHIGTNTNEIYGPLSANSHIPNFESLLGKGGYGGGVIHSDNSPLGKSHNFKPYRNYSITSASDDVNPGERWSLMDAGAGTAGMIIVSW